MTRHKTVHIESTSGKRRRRSPIIRQLTSLVAGGGRTIITHSGKTPFAVWIAIMRKRIGGQFKWKASGSKGRYEVWIEEHSFSRAIANEAQKHDEVASIVWDAEQLSVRDKRVICKILDRFRFAPKRGGGGGLLIAASKASDTTYPQARQWVKLLVNTTALEIDDKPFRRFLAAFVHAINSSAEASLVEQVHLKTKAGYAVTIRLSRRLHGIMKGALARTGYTHIITLIEEGKPPLYRITSDA